MTVVKVAVRTYADTTIGQVQIFLMAFNPNNYVQIYGYPYAYMGGLASTSSSPRYEVFSMNAPDPSMSAADTLVKPFLTGFSIYSNVNTTMMVTL